MTVDSFENTTTNIFAFILFKRKCFTTNGTSLLNSHEFVVVVCQQQPMKYPWEGAKTCIFWFLMEINLKLKENNVLAVLSISNICTDYDQFTMHSLIPSRLVEYVYAGTCVTRVKLQLVLKKANSSWFIRQTKSNFHFKTG